MNASAYKHLTATGDVTTEDTYLRTVVLTGGSAASELVIRAGGGAGSVVVHLRPRASPT